MSVNRLLEMVYILLDKKVVTAKALSEHFEVSQRTIYRDIETLSASGIPIYANKGRSGGISLLDQYVLKKSMLSDKEQISVLSSLQGLNALNVPEVESALKKLSILFDKNNVDWIDVDFSYWGSDAREKDKYNQLKTAILSQKMITFEYLNSQGQRQKRVVEPMQILFKDKSWYLKAYCIEKQDFRIFKIIKMINIEPMSQTFERKIQAKSDIQSIMLSSVTLKLQFSQGSTSRIYDEFCNEDISPNDDGNFTVTATYPENEWLYGYILSFGPSCVVLEPEHIRKEIHKRLAETLRGYL